MRIYQNNKLVFGNNGFIKVYVMRNNGEYKWPSDVHKHEYVQLWYVHNGVCVHKIAGEVTYVKKGELFIVPPFVEHQIAIENSDCVIYCCDFPLELISEDNLISKNSNFAVEDNSMSEFMERLLRVKGKYCFPDWLSARVESIIKRMLDVYIKQQPYSVLELKGYLLRMLTYIIRSEANEFGTSENDDMYLGVINRVLDYTREHITERLYLGDLAKYAQMSVTSFNFYFKKHTGKTFIEYLNTLRIDSAKTILLETSLSIAAVGQEVGIDDLSYFNRLFKQKTGYSPSNFRKFYRDV